MAVDADGDGYCSSGAPVPRCVGQVVADVGFLNTAVCATKMDCDDMSPQHTVNLQIRADSDSDGYCSGPTTAVCAATVPAGNRLASSCATSGNDCRDSNPFATLTCARNAVASRAKLCGTAAVTETFSIPWDCGVGFHSTNLALTTAGPDSTDLNSNSPLFAGPRSGVVTVTATCKPFATQNETYTVTVACIAD